MNGRVLFILILVFWSGLTAQALPVAETPDVLVEEALARNPRLQELKQKWAADEAVIPRAGALPDPIMSLNLLNLPVESLAFNQEPMTGKQIAVKQTFPFWGKLDTRQTIAEKGAEASRAMYQEACNRLIQDVRVAWLDIAFADRALDITAQNRDLMREYVKIAEQKYAVGRGLQQDVLKAQVELSKLEDKWLTWQRKRATLAARLNRLLNRPAGQPFGPTSPLAFIPLHTVIDSLRKQVKTHRPLLKAARFRVAQSAERIDLARKAYGPDITLFAAYTQRDMLQNGVGGADFVSGGVSFNVPLYFWRKQRKQVEENTLRYEGARQAYLEVENKALFTLESVWESLQEEMQRLELYQTGIIPQASQALNAALTAYQTDKVDFLTLINQQLTLFNFELEYERILNDYLKNRARLEYVTGRRLKQ
ncbi:MAG: TolC family protein [Calditrichaeota bacterium]|nr:MAG: TolC family protein [Calditrichota bacterium]